MLRAPSGCERGRAGRSRGRPHCRVWRCCACTHTRARGTGARAGRRRVGWARRSPCALARRAAPQPSLR
eukprot:6339574-Prymnesium_polylepis.1